MTRQLTKDDLEMFLKVVENKINVILTDEKIISWMKTDKRYIKKKKLLRALRGRIKAEISEMENEILAK